MWAFTAAFAALTVIATILYGIVGLIAVPMIGMYLWGMVTDLSP